ncbi:hypothetical protein ABZ553_13440 [Streptomyces sparsogenes]|uniref:esterase/lipase family protein n=1 Tax=Streptomyces sparsogenes TaxID=67365 RepID=UPI0033E6886F
MAGRIRALGVAVAAMCVAALSGLGAPVAAADAGEAAPPRGNSSNETVYLVKGFRPYPLPTGVDCDDRWRPFIRATGNWGWKENQFVKVGFYSGDDNCTINLAEEDGDRDLSLRELGRRLAWNIYLNHSRYGRSVDLVGHSMGGLIVRAAVLGVTHHNAGEDWPPFVYVEDAVTLGTPHYGVKGSCDRFGMTVQCREMTRGSDFLNWLHSARVPQSAQGTDWTFIGSNFDTTVVRDSAVPKTDGAQHRVVYARSERIDHSALRVLADDDAKVLYFSNYGSRWIKTERGASPVRAASNALYWASKW